MAVCTAWQKRLRRTLGAITLAGLIGCGAGQLPNSPNLDAPNAPNAPPTAGLSHPATMRFGLTPFALTKPAGAQTASPVLEKRIGSDGGRMAVANETTLAGFQVPKGALDAPATISMQVLGSGPSAVVEFGPTGLYFYPSATLSITFPADGIDPATLGGYQINDDGTTTPASYQVIVRNNRITVIISIPHFSQYGTDEGEA